MKKLDLFSLEAIALLFPKKVKESWDKLQQEKDNTSPPTKDVGKVINISAESQMQNHPDLKQAIQLINMIQGTTSCVDKTIIAVITDINFPNKTWIGTNGISVEQSVCARNKANLKINQGYALCQTICKQPCHAEISAITQWLKDIKNTDCRSIKECPSAKIYVYGAKAMCNECVSACEEHGLGIENVNPDLNKFLEWLK